jgi:hypothetical protein
VTEQHIGKQDIKRLRLKHLKNVERELGSGLESIPKKENLTNSKKRVKFNWPLCNMCLQKTTDNPSKPGLTPQWADGLWWCETCMFGEYKLEKVKGKYE